MYYQRCKLGIIVIPITQMGKTEVEREQLIQDKAKGGRLGLTWHRPAHSLQHSLAPSAFQKVLNLLGAEAGLHQHTLGI